MKLIAIEEHFLTNEIRNEWEKNSVDDPTHNLNIGEIEKRLDDVGNIRLSLMDETGIDIQVLSLTTPGLHNLGNTSVSLAQRTNDFVAEIIKKLRTDSRDLLHFLHRFLTKYLANLNVQ